jgi:hypothetical protein
MWRFKESRRHDKTRQPSLHHEMMTGNPEGYPAARLPDDGRHAK